jgi:hypothetical protein
MRQYRCAAQITENLANKIFSPDPDHYYLICKDITDQVQGFMILSHYHLSKKLFKNKKFLKIDLLATRPGNIPSILTDVAQRISGIGSALVQVGFEMSADGLVVVPDMAARPFYIKIKFCEIPCNFMMVKEKTTLRETPGNSLS